MRGRLAGTPRLANRLLKRVRDFAQVRYDGRITKAVADATLSLLDVDRCGLDANDRRVLTLMIEKFSGGPVGLETLAAALSEDVGTLEDVVEPYLIQNGFLIRSPRGRMATELAYTHLGLAELSQSRIRAEAKHSKRLLAGNATSYRVQKSYHRVAILLEQNSYNKIYRSETWIRITQK